MPSIWENIQKTVKGEMSDAVVTLREYFKIGKGESDRMNINNSVNYTFQNPGIEVYDHITGEI